MFKHILIPTDGSKTAQEAAQYGIDLAKTFDAEVHVLYAVEPVPLGKVPAGMEAAATEFGDIVEHQKEEGQKAIADVVGLVEGELSINEEIAFGPPGEEILDYAEDHGIDLIVMGTRGRTRSERFLLGSVAEKVTRLSPVPVLTHREG